MDESKHAIAAALKRSTSAVKGRIRALRDRAFGGKFVRLMVARARPTLMQAATMRVAQRSIVGVSARPQTVCRPRCCD